MTKVALNAAYDDSIYKKVIQSRFISFLMFSVFMNVIGVGAVLYLYTNLPDRDYYSTSIEGRYAKLIPLWLPNQSDASVLQWANQAAIAGFTLSFVFYEEELRKASAFFTPGGWEQFKLALEQSNTLNEIKAKNLSVAAVATGAPIILQKGMLNGVYSWRIQMPILIGYQGASGFTQQNNIVTLLVTRIPTTYSSKGIGVSQFVMGGSEQQD